MDMGTWSLFISITGLLIGLVTGYSRLKEIVVAVLQRGNKSARDWRSQLDADANTFARSSSALIAYLVQNASYIAFVAVIAWLVSTLSGVQLLQVPKYAWLGLFFVMGVLVGIRVATVVLMMRLIRRKVVHPSDEG